MNATAGHAVALALFLAGVAAHAEAPDAKTPAVEAVIGVLDKRMGTTKDFVLKPGEEFSWRQISGVLMACDKTEPWERPQTAAFVQVDRQLPQVKGAPVEKPRRIFSGWLFLENPSINPLQDPVYDVWLKSCTISRPDGPKPASSSGGTKASTRASD